MANSHLNVFTPNGTGLGGSKDTLTGICALLSFTETIKGYGSQQKKKKQHLYY